jgi:transcriptional regulator with PAS, ATPase and Fis domain
MNNWMDEFDGAITLCDTNFTIVYMNNRSVKEFEKYGGAKLIGTNLLDCHNPDSVIMIKDILKTGLSNSYVKEKADGSRKVISQSVWKELDEVKGLIEISFYI